jgi:hypothetical protein
MQAKLKSWISACSISIYACYKSGIMSSSTEHIKDILSLPFENIECDIADVGAGLAGNNQASAD